MDEPRDPLKEQSTGATDMLQDISFWSSSHPDQAVFVSADSDTIQTGVYGGPGSTDSRHHTPTSAFETTANGDAKSHGSIDIGVTDKEASKVSKCCSIRKDLLGIKGFYLTFIGALGCVLPYVNVYLKQIGLSPEQIGIISGVRPVVGFLSGPLWGTIADRFNARRLVLMISITAWLAFYSGLYFTQPPVRITQCPTELEPHRKHIRVTRTATGSGNITTISSLSNKTSNLSDHDIELLRENQGWSFESESLNQVFIIALIVIVAGEFFQSPTITLSDAGTLETLGAKGIINYGWQRAWGPVGWALSSLIGGALVSSTRTGVTICGVPLVTGDYHQLVYVFGAFIALAFVCAATIKFKKKKVSKVPVTLANGCCITTHLTPGIHKVANRAAPFDDQKHSLLVVLKLFCCLRHGSWLAMIFFLGTCSGVIWGFLFWHLDNLGGTQLLMGISSIGSCASEFFSFLIIGPLMRRVGQMALLYTAVIGYTVRFLIYAALRNPWLVLPAEILQGVTFSLVVSSMTAYTAAISPPASLATTLGLTTGTFFGLGSGTGHLVGGLLIGRFGAVITFYSFTAGCVLSFFLFLIAQKCSKGPPVGFDYSDLDDH